MDTNWGLVADQRINQELNFKNINSREDYFDALKDLLDKSPQGKTILNLGVLDEMYENSKAQSLVESKITNDLISAQRFERRRPLKARNRDEARTHRLTRKPTRKNVRAWKRHPGRSDIRGVDTKLGVKARRRINLITKKDLGLKSKGIFVSLNIKGVKQYRDKKGRFVKKARL